jgi:pimeloyl-ACP methyl ester carboxylesterase
MLRMPHVELNGVSIYYESTGTGPPLVFSHEFAGDYRSWKPQVDEFSSDYRCVTWNYRGRPPSEVPEDEQMYSQDQLVEDLRALLDHLEIDKAHVAGLSMGGSVTLHFALKYPERCLSAVVAGAGSGSVNRDLFEEDVARIVDLLSTRTMSEFADIYAYAPTRTPFLEKDRDGWELFRRQLSEHSPVGSANMMRNIQLKRPTIFSLKEQLEALRVPTLILVGDEDEPCIEPGVFMRRTIPTSGLMFLPQSGHTINLEEPQMFNQAMREFLAKVDSGRWRTRGSISSSMMPPRA